LRRVIEPVRRDAADVLSCLEDGSLLRLIPRWYADAGAISMYYSSRTLLPAKTRVFIDWVCAAFEAQQLARRFAGSLV
jgi:DNA-binding transcriptional LysR family regulator